MTTIAIYSVKGGVGKTTLAANLAWFSATLSARNTLLWDLDAAGGAAFLYGIDPPRKDRASSLFALDRHPEKLIVPTGIDRLGLLPADESIRELDSQLLQIGKRKRLTKLTEALAKSYDRIILDCPPVLNEISRQVMRAADIVIVPLPPSPLSERAYEVVQREIAMLDKRRPAMLPVLSMVDMRRNLHRAAREKAPDWPMIPMASAIEQGAVRRQPVGAFAPSSPGARAMGRLWTAIERKIARG